MFEPEELLIQKLRQNALFDSLFVSGSSQGDFNFKTVSFPELRSGSFSTLSLLLKFGLLLVKVVHKAFSDHLVERGELNGQTALHELLFELGKTCLMHHEQLEHLQF